MDGRLYDDQQKLMGASYYKYKNNNKQQIFSKRLWYVLMIEKKNICLFCMFIYVNVM